MNSYNNNIDYKNIIAPLVSIDELVDSSSADICRYNIN